MTYQLGAENMADPFGEDALVSLSELRDAQFMNKETYACGKDFVIGQSKAVRGNGDMVGVISPLKQTILSPRKQGLSPAKPSPSPSPYKRNPGSRQSSCRNTPSPLPQQHQLSIKKHHFVSREIPEESMELNSPSQQSGHAFAKGGDELYQEQSISPSTPTSCAYESAGSAAEEVAQTKQARNLAEIAQVTDEKLLKHTESCTPAKDEVVKSHGKHQRVPSS